MRTDVVTHSFATVLRDPTLVAQSASLQDDDVVDDDDDKKCSSDAPALVLHVGAGTADAALLCADLEKFVRSVRALCRAFGHQPVRVLVAVPVLGAADAQESRDAMQKTRDLHAALQWLVGSLTEHGILASPVYEAAALGITTIVVGPQRDVDSSAALANAVYRRLTAADKTETIFLRCPLSAGTVWYVRYNASTDDDEVPADDDAAALVLADDECVRTTSDGARMCADCKFEWSSGAQCCGAPEVWRHDGAVIRMHCGRCGRAGVRTTQQEAVRALRDCRPAVDCAPPESEGGARGAFRAASRRARADVMRADAARKACEAEIADIEYRLRGAKRKRDAALEEYRSKVDALVTLAMRGP